MNHLQAFVKYAPMIAFIGSVFLIYTIFTETGPQPEPDTILTEDALTGAFKEGMGYQADIMSKYLVEECLIKREIVK